MHLYSLYGHEDNIVLIHEKEFIKEEFEKMCKEAPMLIIYGKEYHDSSLIQKYLINNYGFKIVKYTADFFFDDDIE